MLIFEAASALEFLHSKNLIHRALKSFNFLLVKGTVKVSDFGMVAAPQMRLTEKSNDNTRIGSARWLAPEIAAGQFDKKSDLFALGMVLWEIIEGSIPFREVENEAEVLKILHDEKTRPPLPSGCPEVLARLIVLCWDHDAKNRPQLAEILKVADDYAHKGSIPAQVQRPFRRMSLLVH